jgi:hypothetical protein
MSRRSAAVILLLLLAGEARAHRLEAQVFIRPFGFIQVDSWYETGDVPKAARVEVLGPNDEKLTEGRLDDQGSFVFPYKGSGPLNVRVNAGAGHLATVRVKPEELARAAKETEAICAWVACVTPTPSPFLTAPLLVEVRSVPARISPASPHTGPRYFRLLLGAGFLLAVAVVAAVRHRIRGPRPIQRSPTP